MPSWFGRTRVEAVPDDGWAMLSASLSTRRTADEQLSDLLANLARHAGVGIIHLYFPAADDSRFVFVRRAGPGFEAANERPAPTLLSGDGSELPSSPKPSEEIAPGMDGGVETSLHLPPMQLLRGEVMHGEAVFRRMSRLLSWELRNDAGSVAVIELGPVLDDQSLERLREALAAWSSSLSFLIDRLHHDAERESLVLRLQANVEVRERVVKAVVDPLAFMQLLTQLAVVSTGSQGGFVAAPGADGTLGLVAEHGLPEQFRRELDQQLPNDLFEVDTELGIVLVRDNDFLTRTLVTSLLAVPLVEEGIWEGTVALVEFGRETEPNLYSLGVLQVLAEQLGLTLRTRREYTQFSHRYYDSLKSLAQALDASGRQGLDHHAWVTDMAVALGQAYGAAEPVIERTRMAAEIHDIGMCAIAVDNELLSEREHPALGAALLEMLPGSLDVARAVRAQHEWFNGWGFPDGLKREEIPLEGQLLAMAEFAADLRSNDPSLPPFSERFRQAIQERSGTQFDPELVRVAMSIDPAALEFQRLEIERG